jgi:hypothetical protein
MGYMHKAALDLGSWPSTWPISQNSLTGLFGSHGPARPILAVDQHAVADRGVRRSMLASGDESGLNVERRMRGVRKQGPLTLSLVVDNQQ